MSDQNEKKPSTDPKSGHELLSSRPGYEYSASSEASSEEVVHHLSLGIEGRETRLVPVCAVCHTHLNKLCSLDPYITGELYIGLNKGANKGSKSLTVHETDKKASDSSPKTSTDSKGYPPGSSEATTQISSPGSSTDSSTRAKSGDTTSSGNSNKSSKQEEEKKKKKKKNFGSGSSRPTLPSTQWQSSTKPSHEEYQKKKKKDY